MPLQVLTQPAYHGSPYTFDEFKLQHVGTGEGGQGYGWGLYFTDRAKIAQQYGTRLYSVNIPEQGQLLDWYKMISEQSAAVKAALLRNPVTAEFVNRYPSNATGRDLYHFLVQAAQKKNPTFSNSQSAENASKQLLAVGVPGLTCLSYSSNGKPTGARNFVVFDDSQIYVTQPAEGSAAYS